MRVNRELARLLVHLKQRRGARLGARFAVVRWSIKIESYESREQAVEALRRLPRMRQVGLIDRKSGKTWAKSQASFRTIKKTLGHLLLRPLRFMGVI